MGYVFWPRPALTFAVSLLCCAAFFCGYCAATASCRSLRCVWCVLYGFLLQPSFCAAARRYIGSCPESGLNHACVWEANFFSCFSGRRFFVLSFYAVVLRPASLCLLACFVFLLERCQCCLPALPLVYFCQRVA